MTFDYKSFLKTLPNLPGIYQMFNVEHHLIYVGKAQNLKKRVTSYFQKNLKSIKTESLVKQIADIEVIVTKTNAEALLLENNFIKKYKPRYNILFRDDKSYPYIFISAHSNYPRIDFHRGPKKEKGDYYGPFPNSYAVRESIQLIQKIFLVRPCKDYFFNHRSRPCIQYQIKRCTAPCVQAISPENYNHQIRLAKLFLEGKNKEVLDEFVAQMEFASRNLQFERAAEIRDHIIHLRNLSEDQAVIGEKENVDVLAILKRYDVAVIQVLFFRKGRLIGNRNFYPKIPVESNESEILSEFITQYYLSETHSHDIPENIYLSQLIIDQDWIAHALSEKVNHKVCLHMPQRGDKKKWVEMALKNAETDLNRKFKTSEHYQEKFSQLAKSLSFKNIPNQIECFDVSHHSGEATVASCVVFTLNGPAIQSYRRFNIRGITQGDDYDAMKQALYRAYKKRIDHHHALPDLILIDGGKGQLKVAQEVLALLNLKIPLLAISKGTTRKPGLETLYFNTSHNIIELNHDDKALHLLQQIRDEAHRFAITAQRKARDGKRTTSVLQSLSGIGPTRRRLLLQYFGGLEALKNASPEQIATVPGIHLSLAQRIYNYFHEQ